MNNKNKVITIIVVFGIILFGLVGCKNQERNEQIDNQENENIIVYLEDKIADDTISELKDKLKAIDGVKSVKYISKDEAYELLKKEKTINDSDVYTYKSLAQARIVLEVKKSNDYSQIVNEARNFNNNCGGIKSIKTPTDSAIETVPIYSN